MKSLMLRPFGNHMKMKTLRRQVGFALIELMVVVAVLSVIAAFFVPRFLKHQIQRKQEECRKNLQALHETEKNYYQREGVFTTDLSLLGWKPSGKAIYEYQFIPSPPPKNGYLFHCKGNIDKDPTVDEAQIDETGQISQVVDDTKK